MHRYCPSDLPRYPRRQPVSWMMIPTRTANKQTDQQSGRAGKDISCDTPTGSSANALDVLFQCYFKLCNLCHVDLFPKKLAVIFH